MMIFSYNFDSVNFAFLSDNSLKKLTIVSKMSQNIITKDKSEDKIHKAQS